MNFQLINLYDRIYKDDSSRDPRTFITNVEKEIGLIDTADYEDYEDYRKATRLVSDYGIMLCLEGSLKKAHKYLVQAIRQFENDKFINDKELLVEPLYEALIFHLGIILYKHKKFKESRYYFKRLVDKFPDNDLYKKWLKASVAGKYGIIEWIFFVVTLISIVLFIFFKPQNGIIDKIALLGIFIGLFSSLYTRYLRIRTFKQDNYTA